MSKFDLLMAAYEQKQTKAKQNNKQIINNINNISGLVSYEILNDNLSNYFKFHERTLKYHKKEKIFELGITADAKSNEYYNSIFNENHEQIKNTIENL